MLNYIIAGLIAVIAVVGSFFPRNTTQIWDEASRIFGTTNFPTSLDTLTNPSGTDSVATVSHSSQHANANDAIEAIEAKTGTGASTPTANTVLYGNGTGSSAWSATPSLTSMILSGLGTFGSFISNASSTIVGNLNITGNSTSTNATSTNLFSTNTNFTNLNGTNVNGYGLSACSGGNFVQWDNGTFGCGSPAASTMISTTTTTGTWYATTTITGLSANKIYDVSIYIGTTTALSTSGKISFNDTLDDISYCTSINGGTQSCSTGKYFAVQTISDTFPSYINLTIDNKTGHYRTGTYQYIITNPNNIHPASQSLGIGVFTWATTTSITSISIKLDNPSFKMSSTTIDVFQK